MKRLALAFLALLLAPIPANATSLIRLNGSYLVGYSCVLADGTKFACPAATITDSSGVEVGTSSNPFRTAPAASATGGLSTFSKLVANNTTSFAVDASPGTLYGVRVWNNSATILYLKLYDVAQGSVTCGTPTPKQRIMIPASTSGAGAVISIPAGVAYGTAITACVTAAYADNDTTAPAASTAIVEMDYK